MAAADATVTMRYNADTKSATKSMNTFGSAIKKVGTMMATVFSVKAIYEIGSAYQKSFAKVSTLIDETAVSMSALNDNVLELSNETGVTADEINEGLYQALSAGVDITEDGSDALGFMDKMLKLAAGGFSDTATAVDTTTAIMSAYNLEQSKTTEISDMLIATQNEGSTTVGELGSSLGQVIPIAAQLGVTYDQVGASLATLTTVGASGTAESATKLKALFNELSQSTTESGIAFERVAGKSFIEFIKGGGTVSEAMAMMQDYAIESGVEVSQLFSSVEAGSAAATLASEGGLAKFDGSLNSIQDSAGATGKAFEKVSSTDSYKLEKSFNKIKNAGIKAFLALAPVINLVSTVLSAVAAVLTFVVSGFDGTNKVASIVVGTLTALVAIWGILLAIQNASAIATWAQNAAIAALVNIELIWAAVTNVVTGAFGVLSAAVNSALWPILAIVAVVAAVIAIFAIFGGKTDVQKRCEEDTKALKEEREAIDDTIDGFDDTAASAKVAAKGLVDLSKKVKKGEASVSDMQSQVDALNDALGEDVVSVDEATGAILVYGKEVDDVQDALDGLIDLQNAQSKATEYQTKLNDALAKKEEAQIALQEEQAGNIDLTNKEIRAYNKLIEEAETGIAIYEEGLESANGVIEEQTVAMQELETQAAQQVTGTAARNAALEQLESERELTYDEHLAAIKEMEASNYAEMGLTEEEYINQLAEHHQAVQDATAEHQQAIEDATAEHLDTLLGINEDGLYNEELTHEKWLESTKRNTEQQQTYNENIEALAKSRYENVTEWLRKEGVESGTLAQEYADALYLIQAGSYDDIQSLTEDEAAEFLKTYNRAMGTSFKSVNDITAGKWEEVTATSEGKLDDMETAIGEASYTAGETAANEYGDGVEDLSDGIETTCDDANTAMETGGETVAETSEEAGEDAAQGFISGVEDNLGDVKTIGELTGTSWMTGVIAGINAMKGALRSKLYSIARGLKISASVSSSSSGVNVSTSLPAFATGGMVYEPTVAVVGDNKNAHLDPEVIAPVSKLKAILTSQLDSLVRSAIPSLGSNGATYNYYNDNKTDSSQNAPALAIENYYQNSDQDQQKLVGKLEIAYRNMALAKGTKT